MVLLDIGGNDVSVILLGESICCCEIRLGESKFISVSILLLDPALVVGLAACGLGASCVFAGVFFFFWMDMLGTLSIMFDVPWLTPAGFDASEGQLLRASRTSRLGAKAARLTKLIRLVKVVRVLRIVKIMKYLPFFGGGRRLSVIFDQNHQHVRHFTIVR